MNYLLDTSAFIWYVSAPGRLSRRATSIVNARENSIYLSLASVWEMAIKVRVGKLELVPAPYSQWIDRELAASSFKLLDIRMSHIKQTAELPLYHRDPFDRLLIAQALTESLPLISNDAAFDSYRVERLW